MTIESPTGQESNGILIRRGGGREPKEWNKATSKNGGLHLYINRDIVKDSLKSAGITDSEELRIKAIPLKTDRKGTAKFVVLVRVR